MPEPQGNGVEEIEVDAKQGRIKVRGSDILTTLGIAGVVLVAYMVFEHKEDTKSTQLTFAAAVKEMTATQKEMLLVQRVQNCLLATEQSEREMRLPTCERLAR